MKIVLLGDSITQGIGSKKINYSDKIQDKIPNSVVDNLGFTGTTIKYAKMQLTKIKEINPDFLIVFYGNVDAMPRIKQNSKIYKMLPRRYKHNGMLNPRALYTSKKPLRYIQKIDSYIRTMINKILINTQGYYQWVGIDEFESEYKEFINIVSDYVERIILISTVPMYDKWFPFANKEYKKYNECIKRISNEYNLQFIDVFTELDKYEKKDVFLDDYFHPNEKGYNIIAKNIVDKIRG